MLTLSLAGWLAERPGFQVRSWIAPILPEARVDVHNDAVAALVRYGFFVYLFIYLLSSHSALLG